MQKSESLIRLVCNLAKQEKKEFSLHISGKGDRDYIHLFRLIDRAKITSPEELKRAFAESRPGASFSTAVGHLFDVLLDILADVRRNQDSYYQLFGSLLHARVLYEKSMFHECFQTLRRVKERAAAWENHFVLLIAQRLELNWLLTLDFEGLDEARLLASHHSMKSTIRSISQLGEQSSLLELLKLRMVNRGASHSREEAQKLDDLVTSEISIVASAGVENFEIKKNHQLFQANYFITVGDYRAAFNSFIELNRLFEDNGHLWNNPPVYYLMTLEGILDSLRIMRNYAGMEYFIGKLEKLRTTSANFQLDVAYVIFIYRLFAYIDTGEFAAAAEWVSAHQSTLIDKMWMLKEKQQTELSLYLALTHFGNGEYRKAGKRLGTARVGGHLYSMPQFRINRIVNVMIHYELKEFDYIHSEIRSIKREMSKNRDNILRVEHFLLKFLNYSFVATGKQRARIWERMEHELTPLYTDKYEKQILSKFDFVAWIESKFTGEALGAILKRKYAREATL